MGLFAYAGKLRIAASELICFVARVACGEGECCGGKWHAAGAEGTQSSCASGQVYLRWGGVDEGEDPCCGCLSEQIPDGRAAGGMSNTVDVQDDLCCPLHPLGTPLPFDPITGEEVGCMQRCCRDGVCTDEPRISCQETGGISLPGDCASLGCPVDCCSEDADGNVTCGTVDSMLCDHPADPDCATGCLGQCCLDGEPQGMMTQGDCEAMDGLWQGLGVEECGPCPCRAPYDCDCCENVTSTAAGITFTQPRRKRSPQFADTFRVAVTGRTESSIYVHGVPVGAACEFEVTFLLCGESFNIEPVECGTNFKKLDVTVCWQEEHTSGETLGIRGCETGTIAAGSCRPDGCNGSGDCTPGSECTTTLLHDEDGAETSASIQVNGRLTIDSSGTGPLVLTGDLTVPAASCSLTIVVTGTNDDLNRIDGDILQQGANVVIVEKRGPGTWGLAGANTYTGQLRVLEGTLVVLADVDSGYGTNPSPFGKTPTSSVYPVVGGDASNTITAAMLLADGVTIERAFTVPANAAQTVVLGGYSGTSSVASSVTPTLMRDVTLKANSGATVTFNNEWLTSGVDPTFTIDGGTVVLANYLPGSYATYGGTTEAVLILAGTLRTSSTIDNTIDPTTPVTIGAATLDINSRSQALASLTFTPGPAAITNGTLSLGYASIPYIGSSAGTVAVDGSGHEIDADVTLGNATTITVEDDSDLTVSGVVSGSGNLTLDGDGTLTLSSANTYSGTTTINGGTAVAGDQDAFGTGAIVVNAGGTLNKGGFTLPNTITNNGGTVIP